MTRDPFLRLALIAACSLYMAGVAVVSRWLGATVGFLVLLFGFGAAYFLSIDWLPDETTEGTPRPRSEGARRSGFPSLRRLGR